MNSDFSFFIYDYESFGINPASDRPAQFGGIRTDKDFNIIGEPVMFYCKQTNDYLPAPEAVLVTGITPQECNEKGVSEPEFAARILAEFSQPNTCIMGFNNIRYDDEMTRYTFYRNFIDPYAYSWQQGNSRWDLLDLLRACYALRPEGINWPKNEDGLPTFKLERLTKANGIEHGAAHDALADVYATIEMAKLIKAKQPRIFDYFFKNRGKKEITKLIDVANMTPLVHTSGMIGNARANTTLVAPLAWHPTNNNAVICCDLTQDISDLLKKDAHQLQQYLYTKKENLEEQGILPVPLKLVHINKCPILAPEKTLTPQNAENIGIDREYCMENWRTLRDDPNIREKVVEIFTEQRQFADNDDVETQLYGAFFSHNDKSNMELLRHLSPQELADNKLIFTDERIEKLLFNYRARHYFSSLNRAEQVKWQKQRITKLEKQAPRFVESLERLMLEHGEDERKSELLQKVYEYGAKLLA